jgi:hypothetical protein
MAKKTWPKSINPNTNKKIKNKKRKTNPKSIHPNTLPHLDVLFNSLLI